MNNILIALGVLFVAAIAAAFAAPHVVDWNHYRGAIEEEVSRALGRDVRIGGNLAFTLLPTPGFTLDRIRVADAVSGSGEPAFRAEQLAVKLSFAPLLRGVLEAHEIEIRKARVRVPLTGFGLSRAKLQSDTFQFPIEIQDVALQAVRFTDSEIVIHRGDGAPVTTLAGLDGEFAAATLEGPYRFRGTFGDAAERLELRISTQRTEADGSIRFKAGLKQVGGRGTLALDGRLADPRQAIRVEGELTGELPLPRSPGMPTDVAEIRSPLTADAEGVQLAGLSLVFEQQGRPQILSGNARLAWHSAVDISGDLSARWLDLDRIIGLEGKGSPLPALVALLSSSTNLSRAGGRTSLNLAIDQANLGGEAVSGVIVRMSGDNGAITVEEVGVGLPGGTRAEVTGAITQGDRSFRGSMMLQGASLSRFLGWAAGDTRSFVGVAEGSFWLRTALDLGPTGLIAGDMMGRALDVPLWGDLQWRWERERTLAVSINGQQLNVASLLGEETSFLRVLEGLPGTLERLGIARDTRVEMRLRADEVHSARMTLTNVVTEAAVTADTVSLRRLQFSLPEGATAEIEGDFGRDGSATAFRGAASVKSSEALDALAGIVGQGWIAALPKSRRDALLPMEIAGKARLMRDGTPVAVEFDGTVAGQPIVATLAASGPAGDGAQNYDVSIDVLGVDETSVLRFAGMQPRVATDSVTKDAQAQGATLRVRAAGTMREGMHTVAAWDAPKSRATFQGLVKGDPSAIEASGLVAVAGYLDGELFAPLRPYLGAPTAGGQSPLTGSARVTLKGTTLAAEQILVKMDATSLSGSLSLERDADVTRVAGRLEADTLDLGAVLAPAITRDNELTAAISMTSGRAGPWPEKPFDFSRLAGVSGTVELSARRLSFVDGLGLADARVVIGVAPGRVELRDMSGRGLSGTWSGNVRIEQVPGGGEISGMIAVKGARMDGGDGATGAAKPSGVADATATFSGRGIGVRGALSALAGRGSVDIGGARVAQLSPRQVTQAVEAALRGPADAVTANLRASLQRAPAGVDVTARGLGFEISEGVVRLKPFSIDGADGRIEGVARLDLATMTTDIEWRIEARQPAPVALQQPAVQTPASAPARQPRRLPPVTVTISGPLAALGRAEAAISMDALERELVVRKMERDLEELERLRKLDEERAREDAERRRLLEQGQQSAPQPPLADPTGAQAAGAQAGPSTLPDPTITPTPLADTVAPPPSQPRQRRTAPATNAPRQQLELRGGG